MEHRYQNKVCDFYSFTMAFEKQKFWVLTKLSLPQYDFTVHAFRVLLKNIFPIQNHKDFCPVFFTWFMVLSLTFRPPVSFS